MNPTIEAVTERIRSRSAETRAAYIERCRAAIDAGPARAHLSCGNIAHAAAASGADKAAIAGGRGANIGIVTAYNDMLSAHQPFERFPALIRQAARAAGALGIRGPGALPACPASPRGDRGHRVLRRPRPSRARSRDS